MRCLDFLQIIDSHRIVVSFARQEYFNKIADHIQLNQCTRIVFRMARHGLIRCPFTLAACDVISLPNALRHRRKRKRIADRDACGRQDRHPAIVAQEFGRGRFRKQRQVVLDERQLRQAPIRHACAHAALNDQGSWIHRESILALCSHRACLTSVMFHTLVSASTTSVFFYIQANTFRQNLRCDLDHCMTQFESLPWG